MRGAWRRCGILRVGVAAAAACAELRGDARVPAAAGVAVDTLVGARTVLAAMGLASLAALARSRDWHTALGLAVTGLALAGVEAAVAAAAPRDATGAAAALVRAWG